MTWTKKPYTIAMQYLGPVSYTFTLWNTALLVLLAVYACTDDAGVKPYSFKEITTFTIPAVNGQPLHAAIYENTILVYWPPDADLPAFVTPNLNVAERAVVTPASGEQVALRDGITYTVTAEDGTTASYTLKVVVTQPKPVMTITFNAFEIAGTSWNVSGFNYLVPDTLHTHLYLVAPGGAETPIPLQAVKINTITTKPVTEAGITPGEYRLRVTTGIHTMLSEAPMIEAYIRPVIESFSPLKGRVGDEVAITGSHFDEVVSGNVVKFGDKVAEVVSASATQLMVKVPEGAATGAISVTTAQGYGDQSSSAFILLTGNSTVVSTYAGTGVSGYGDGTTATAQLRPYGAVIDAGGNMYVADYGNSCIRKITPGGEVTTLAGSTTAGNADGTGAAAQFRSPQSIAIDISGNLYVADAGNHRIRKVSPAGVVTTLAGSSSGFVNGVGAAAKFNSPRGIAVDAQGNVFVSDYNNFRIRKVAPDGTVTVFAGSGAWAFADGVGVDAKFGYINRLAIDGQGNLYASDNTNQRIRKITPQAEVSTYAGSGDEGYLDGAAAQARFFSPFGLIVDAQGNVYVGENGNYRIRKITPQGMVSTYAGSGASGHADGAGDEAMFKSLQGLAADAQGNIYVADYSNYRIRKVVPEQ